MDWIEFTVGKQNWAKGVRLCGNVPGEPIHTGAKKLYLNFYSDATNQGRGVWLKYMGKSCFSTKRGRVGLKSSIVKGRVLLSNRKGKY
jgi:hypothetical protein